MTTSTENPAATVSTIHHAGAEGPVVLENMQFFVWFVTIPVAALCMASVLVRLYTRRYICKSFGADDWLMAIILPVWMGQQSIAWMWTILGGGLHIRVVPAENVARINFYLFAEEFYYLFLQLLIKMSFLCFYLRALTATIGFQRAVYAVMGLVCCQTVGTWVFYGLQCTPIDAYFHPELYPNRRCIASSLAYYLPSVANVSVDAIIYIMPIFPIWSLQASLRRRLGLIFLFTMGGAAVAVSLLRFIVLWQLSNTADVTYVFGSVTIVTSVEFAVAIITANMPGVSGFLHYLKSRGQTEEQGPGHDQPRSMGGDSGFAEGGGVDDVYGGRRGSETVRDKTPRKVRHDTLNSALEFWFVDHNSWKGADSQETLTTYSPRAAFELHESIDREECQSNC